MASGCPELPESCGLPNKQLEEWIGLHYDREENVFDVHLENFRMQGTGQHYRFVEAGPCGRSFILEQISEPCSQFLLEIVVTYYQGDQFCCAKCRPWKGLPAFEAEEARVKETEAARRAALAAEHAEERALALSRAPKCTELVPKLADEGWRCDTFARLFAPEPSVVLSLAASDGADGARTLSFTTVGGAEVYALQLSRGEDLPGDFWPALASRAGAPGYGLSISSPGGHVINGPPAERLLLEHLLTRDVASTRQDATLTALANFCMADESSDLPVDFIRWTQLDAPTVPDFGLQQCAAAFRDSSIAVKAAYRSENVRSKRCWWVDNDFRAFVLDGDHEGVTLIEHKVNKDMS